MSISNIEKTVELYASGIYEADASKLRQAFFEIACMDGVVGTDIFSMTAEEFISAICSDDSMKSKGIDYTYVIDSISVSNKTASVAIREFGFNGRSDYKTFFLMIRTEDGWRIYHKVFELI